MSFAAPLLELDRIRLRVLDDRDVPGLFAIYSDADITRYLARPALTEMAEAEAMLARARKGLDEETSLQLAVERREDGAFLGNCLLFNFNMPSARAEIGYSFDRSHWSRGYATEALRGLIDYGFGPLALRRIEADIDPRNGASARLLERLGFTREAVLRERWMVKDEVSDTVMYGLLRREWPAPQEERTWTPQSSPA